MKKILLLLTSAILAVTVRGNTVVFNTLGPNDTYNPNQAYPVEGGSQVAAQFTSGASGFLDTVELGLTFQEICGPVNVFLYADAAGLPDNGNQMLLGTTEPTTPFGTTNNTILSFTVLGDIPVTIGTNYWLVLKATNPNDRDTWNFSLASFGLVFASFDDSTWIPFPVGGGTLPAFRLTARDGNAVPESGSTFAFMFGAVVGLFVLQRTWKLAASAG